MTHKRILAIEQAVLAKNDEMAALNRAEYARRGLLVLNIVSSPGSGKTAFLERTLRDIAGEIPMAVIVGDLATDNDAKRLDGKGARVLQITTDGYCHLEANMIAAACEQIGLDGLRLLIIENVGNLVCPSSHDLGEDLRVVLLSVTEGEDKPLKYPVVFKSADIAIVSKMDLAAAVEFKREDAIANIHAVAPDSKIFEVSSKSGAGMDAWYDFLRANLKAAT